VSQNRTSKPPARRRDLAVDPNDSATKSSNEKSESADKKSKRRGLFGLVKRKEKWALTARGWLVSVAAFAVLTVAFILWVHPFLAVTERVDADYLVIEGWIPNYALQESIDEFKSKPYKMIFTVGADPMTGVHIEQTDSIAIEAWKRLKFLGMNPDLVTPVPARIKYRNRTFQSAVALRKWGEDNHLPMTSFNLVTVGPHARRSRLLFEEAFDGKARVGIISVEDREYDPKRWWKYSEGVKEILGEGVGYIYARFFFHPGKQ
jgi:hypothetical protein